jgi:uncharacterized membrane protein
MTWFTFFLLLHVVVAITAFGPVFAFPFVQRFAQRDPRNALVVAEILHGIQGRIVIPAAVAMPFLGLALIYLGHIDLWKSEWLLIAIALYVVAFFFSLLVQLRNSGKMVDLLARQPVRADAAQATPPVPGAGGPPPEVAAMGRRLQLGGMLLTVLILAIILLMVWRPGNCVGAC